MIRKYKLIIAYDGTNYSGWQVQPNGTSIQSLIQNALQTALRAKVDLTGSSRTDAGVHAWGQVAHFSTDVSFENSRLLSSLNALLPQDIRIREIAQVDDSFHARYSTTHKIYHYHLHLDQTTDPFQRLYSLHVRHKIDLNLLKQAACHFVGTKDFTSFANDAHLGRAAKNPVRTLSRLDIVEEKNGIRLEFEGDGFLYKMVRNIVGTLLDVASGKIAVDAIPKIFAARNRSKAGQAAPAHGLFLREIYYLPQCLQMNENESHLQNLQVADAMAGR